MRSIVLVYKDRFTGLNGEVMLQDKELTVSGDQAGINFLPNENPVAVQIWANTEGSRQSQGCLLSSMVRYNIEG